MTADVPDPVLRAFGDSALLVEFGDRVDPALNAAVMALDSAVAEAGIPGIVETAPSFRSLLVEFDPLRTDGVAVTGALRTLLSDLQSVEAAGRRWVVPVCYEGDLAPDLGAVADRVGLEPVRVVDLHTGAEHRVHMIGFLPGCPYLGGLPPEIDLPRRADPRLRVPKGAVAIAVGLTVIYPTESPGGWNLIGRTPAEMFAIGANPPALLAPGDRVRFDPVGRAAFDDMERAAAAGDWMPEMEQ